MGERGDQPDLSGADLHIAIVVARYNEDVTKRLLRGALGALTQVFFQSIRLALIQVRVIAGEGQ